jgi:hypothetical protein
MFSLTCCRLAAVFNQKCCHIAYYLYGPLVEEERKLSCQGKILKV